MSVTDALGRDLPARIARLASRDRLLVARFVAALEQRDRRPPPSTEETIRRRIEAARRRAD